MDGKQLFWLMHQFPARADGMQPAFLYPKVGAIARLIPPDTTNTRDEQEEPADADQHLDPPGTLHSSEVQHL